MTPGVRRLAAVAIVLALVFASALGASVVQLRQSATANARVESLVDLRRWSTELLKLQVDEESGIRGYITNADRVFLDPFYRAEPKLGRLLDSIEGKMIGDEQVAGDLALIRRAERLHLDWIQSVAEPSMLAGKNRQRSVAYAGKALMDEMRDDMEQLDADIAKRIAGERTLAEAAFLRGIALGAAAIAAAVGLIVATLIFLRETSDELSRERAITGVLQRAFTGSSESSADLSFGSAYVSATKGAAVGGDFFDLHAVNSNRQLILIADVSGKGVHAAVDTALIKFASRTLARSFGDAAKIAEALNELYRHERAGSGSFVVLFLALLEAAPRRFTFVNAGLASAYRIRGAEVEMLGVTGPAIGVASNAGYRLVQLDFQTGDRIVLATDGLIEARSPSGEFIGEDRLEEWIHQESGRDNAQAIVDGLIGRLRSFTGNRLDDDLAVIALIAGGDKQDVA